MDPNCYYVLWQQPGDLKVNVCYNQYTNRANMHRAEARAIRDQLKKRHPMNEYWIVKMLRELSHVEGVR